MATAPTIDLDTPQFSSNDSHIHLNVEGRARRERLNLTLKAGETDEIDAAGPQHLCKQCSPNGEVPPPARPSNKTYDRSLEIAEANENAALKQQVADMSEWIAKQKAKDALPKKPAA